MKNPNRETVSRLDALPNIGKAIAGDLQLIGIDHPKKLIGKDPFKLYEALCTRTGKRHDPCVIDVFMSVVHFMEGGDPPPWWSFTDERKNTPPNKTKRDKENEIRIYSYLKCSISIPKSGSGPGVKKPIET